MGNKNKTISFRVKEAKFDELRRIADAEDLSLSKLFRNYVDSFIAHEGNVEVVPKHKIRDEATGDRDFEFPVKVEVPKSFVREHERLELECEHLREQLDEYKRYTTRLTSELDEIESNREDIVHLEELDTKSDPDDSTFHLG